MKQSIIRAIVLSLPAALGAASSARAAGEAGWYAGISLGRSIERMGGSGIDSALATQGISSTSTLDRRDTAAALFGGYRFTRNFALEGGYTSLGRFNINSTATAPAAGVATGHYSAQGVELDALGIAPIAERWSLYGKAGLLYAKSDLQFDGNAIGAASTHSWGAAPVLGLGVSYDLTRNVSARLETARYFRVGDTGSGRSDIDQYTVGLVYRFQ